MGGHCFQICVSSHLVSCTQLAHIGDQLNFETRTLPSGLEEVAHPNSTSLELNSAHDIRGFRPIIQVYHRASPAT
jgi:hypothetical protein